MRLHDSIVRIDATLNPEPPVPAAFPDTEKRMAERARQASGECAHTGCSASKELTPTIRHPRRRATAYDKEERTQSKKKYDGHYAAADRLCDLRREVRLDPFAEWEARGVEPDQRVVEQVATDRPAKQKGTESRDQD